MAEVAEKPTYAEAAVTLAKDILWRVPMRRKIREQ